jgi:hypothetical protein
MDTRVGYALCLRARLRCWARRRSIGVRSRRLQIASNSACVWMIAALLLLVGCAPATDEQVRLAGIGTARAAPDPKLVPRFTEASFIAADGQNLPLRKWYRTAMLRAR